LYADSGTWQGVFQEEEDQRQEQCLKRLGPVFGGLSQTKGGCGPKPEVA